MHALQPRRLLPLLSLAFVACALPPTGTSAVAETAAPAAVELEGLSTDRYVLVRDHVLPSRKMRGPELGGLAPIMLGKDDEAAAKPWIDRCPEDGLILTIVARTVPEELAKDSKPSGYCLFDRVWCTRSEARALVPGEPSVGDVYTLPAGFTRRLARLHLLDREGGAGASFDAEDVETSELSAEVLSTHDSVLRLSITGEIAADDGERRLMADLRGTAAWDFELASFTSFELVADAESSSGDRSRRVGFVLMLSRSPNANLLPPRFIELYEPFAEPAGTR